MNDCCLGAFIFVSFINIKKKFFIVKLTSLTVLFTLKHVYPIKSQKARHFLHQLTFYTFCKIKGSNEQ